MALTIPDSMNNMSRGFTTRDLFFHLGFGLRTRASMARVWLEYDSGMAQVRLGIIFMFSITDYQLQCCKRLRPILCIHICHFSNAVSLYRRSQLAMQAFLGILSLHIVPLGNHWRPDPKAQKHENVYGYLVWALKTMLDTRLTKVACGWAGVVKTTVNKHLGRSSYAKTAWKR